MQCSLFLRKSSHFFLYLVGNISLYNDKAGTPMTLNPLLANDPILYPLENTRKPLVFWCFQGV